MRAKQKVRSALSKYQRILASKPGILGNGAGIVDDPKRTGYSFVRIAGAPAISVINKRCASIDGLYVWVGYDPVEPDILQVLSIRGIQKNGISGIGTALGVAKHGVTHQWMNRDTSWIHLRQMIPFRPTPAGGMMLKIGEGISFIGDNWIGNTGATINMAPYIPGSGAQYGLVYMNPGGMLDVLTGEVKTLNDLIASDIPAPIPGTMPIAAIRLYPGMSTIAESRIASDLVDLRWMGVYENSAGSTGTSYNRVPTATYYPNKDYLLTGSSYYPLDPNPARYIGESISALVSGSSTFYLGGFMTAPEGLGATEITGGTWVLAAKVFFSILDPLGMSASARVYSVSSGTVETELFNGTIGTHDANHLFDQDFALTTTQPAFVLDPLDRLLVKYYITGVASSYGFASIGLGPWDGTKVMVPPYKKSVSSSTDHKVMVSSDDTMPNYLSSKLSAGSNVTLTVLNPGADESIEISASSGTVLDGKLKVSNGDTTPNYLEDKISAGSGIIFVKNNAGGNETLTISSTGTSSGATSLADLTDVDITGAGEGDSLVLHSGTWIDQAGVDIDSDAANIISINMTEQGSAPTTPGSGHRKIFAKDNGWYDLDDNGTETKIGSGIYSAVGDYILIQDQKAQNTGGGTFTLGAWRTRDLNTEVSDDGGYASVASNQITLLSGTYTFHISCPAFAVNRHQALLYNVTDNAVIAVGSSEVSGSNDSTGSRSVITGKVVLASNKVLEVRHQSQSTQATYGFGVEANFTTEVYTIAEFWRIG